MTAPAQSKQVSQGKKGKTKNHNRKTKPRRRTVARRGPDLYKSGTEHHLWRDLGLKVGCHQECKGTRHGNPRSVLS